MADEALMTLADSMSDVALFWMHRAHQAEREKTIILIALARAGGGELRFWDGYLHDTNFELVVKKDDEKMETVIRARALDPVAQSEGEGRNDG